MPIILRGAKLAKKHTCLPSTSSALKCSAIPLKMVRSPWPSLTISFKSFLLFGTFSAATIVPTRMSILAKSSNWVSGFGAATVLVSSSFMRLAWCNFSIWVSMVLSSIFSNNKNPSPISWPAGSKSARPANSQLAHSAELMPNCCRIFWAVKGINGSQTMASVAAICSDKFIIPFTASGSVLMACQGWVSAKYLLPSRATSIKVANASRKR